MLGEKIDYRDFWMYNKFCCFSKLKSSDLIFLQNVSVLNFHLKKNDYFWNFLNCLQKPSGKVNWYPFGSPNFPKVGEHLCWAAYMSHSSNNVVCFHTPISFVNCPAGRPSRCVSHHLHQQIQNNGLPSYLQLSCLPATSLEMYSPLSLNNPESIRPVVSRGDVQQEPPSVGSHLHPVVE